MAIEYDIEPIENKLKSLSSKIERLEYLNDYLFHLKKKKAEFTGTDSNQLNRLIEITAKDFDLFHSEMASGRLIYWYNNDAKDERMYKKVGFKNIPLLKKRLTLENNLSDLKGRIELFENLIEREKNKVDFESKAYQPKISIGLDCNDFSANSDFSHLYFEIRFNAENKYLQAKVKDEFGRIIQKHSGYKLQIIERLKFALYDWLIYQKESGNLTEPTANRVKENQYMKAKGAEAIYNWLLNKYPSQSETKSDKLKAPVLGLFCNLINKVGIDKKGQTENASIYCERICNKFKLPYTDRVRQNYNVNETQRLIRELIEKVFPLIDTDTKKKIQGHLDNKSPTKQNLYV